jgi:hypothetical protein
MPLLPELMKIVFLLIASLGGGGAIILGLSSWFGKIWADRLMQKQRATYEKEIEEFKATALQSLEREKATNQRGLEDFKAQLSREGERSGQALHERVNLYKECLAPVIELIMTAMHSGEVNGQVMFEFDKTRLVTSAGLGMFAPLPVFEAYNETIEYLQDCFEKKVQFEFSEFRKLGFTFLNAVRRDLGIHSEDLIYRGSR